MKEVPKKDLPDVSGGEYQSDGCIPDPFKLGFPPEPTIPVDPTIVDA
jgi:hypothetical protein